MSALAEDAPSVSGRARAIRLARPSGRLPPGTGRRRRAGGKTAGPPTPSAVGQSRARVGTLAASERDRGLHGQLSSVGASGSSSRHWGACGPISRSRRGRPGQPRRDSGCRLAVKRVALGPWRPPFWLTRASAIRWFGATSGRGRRRRDGDRVLLQGAAAGGVISHPVLPAAP